jgi:hypothetical protein
MDGSKSGKIPKRFTDNALDVFFETGGFGVSRDKGCGQERD